MPLIKQNIVGIMYLSTYRKNNEWLGDWPYVALFPSGKLIRKLMNSTM